MRRLLAFAALSLLLSASPSAAASAAGAPDAVDETAARWFVELSGAPRADGGEAATLRQEKARFRSAARAAGIALRERGAFDAPLVWHSGFDVQNLDLDVMRALDGHLVCNREKLAYWTAPVAEGGCGLDVGDCEVVEAMDSDRPKVEFMNDRFAARLSDRDGDLHTVCAGRPLGIDVVAAARRGIHVHVYANSHDDVAETIARSLSPHEARRSARLLRRHVHLHPSLQTIGASWAEVQRVKERWVEEFSRYDAGWSTIGNPFGHPPLDDRAALANKTSTYLLAGLPVITDRRRGHYRYEELRRLGVELELVDGDYDGLRERIADEARTGDRRRRAVAERAGYSFDATIDPLLDALERAT